MRSPLPRVAAAPRRVQRCRRQRRGQQTLCTAPSRPATRLTQQLRLRCLPSSARAAANSASPGHVRGGRSRVPPPRRTDAGRSRNLFPSPPSPYASHLLLCWRLYIGIGLHFPAPDFQPNVTNFARACTAGFQSVSTERYMFTILSDPGSRAAPAAGPPGDRHRTLHMVSSVASLMLALPGSSCSVAPPLLGL